MCIWNVHLWVPQRLIQIQMCPDCQQLVNICVYIYFHICVYSSHLYVHVYICMYIYMEHTSMGSRIFNPNSNMSRLLAAGIYICVYMYIFVHNCMHEYVFTY
jgi:hypothetical protein